MKSVIKSYTYSHEFRMPRQCGRLMDYHDYGIAGRVLSYLNIHPIPGLYIKVTWNCVCPWQQNPLCPFCPTSILYRWFSYYSNSFRDRIAQVTIDWRLFHCMQSLNSISYNLGLMRWARLSVLVYCEFGARWTLIP